MMCVMVLRVKVFCTCTLGGFRRSKGLSIQVEDWRNVTKIVNSDYASPRSFFSPNSFSSGLLKIVPANFLAYPLT